MLNRIYKIIVVSIFLMIFLLIIKGYYEKNEIENNCIESVGKYVSIDSWGKGELNFFIFFIDGKKYKGNGGRAPRGFSKNIEKYYKICYSAKYKGKLIANYNQEVTDTTEILKAGFSMDEILNKKTTSKSLFP